MVGEFFIINNDYKELALELEQIGYKLEILN